MTKRINIADLLRYASKSPISIAMITILIGALLFIPIQQNFFPHLGDAAVIGFYRVLPLVIAFLVLDLAGIRQHRHKLTQNKDHEK